MSYLHSGILQFDTLDELMEAAERIMTKLGMFPTIDDGAIWWDFGSSTVTFILKPAV